MSIANHIIKPLFSWIAIAGLAISMIVTPAFALNNEVEQFRDVPKTHAYYETILEARQTGVVSGVNETDFLPDNPVSIAEFITMYANLFAPDAFSEVSSEDDWKDTAYQVGVSLGLVSRFEALGHLSINCTWGTMVPRILKVAGLTTYSAQLWGEEETYPDGLTVPMKDALASARQYGLLEGIAIEDYTGILTRAETLQLLYNLQNSETLDALPGIIREVEVDFEVESAAAENSVYQALLILPEKYIDLWNDSGWTMRVVTTPIWEVDEQFAEHTNAVGLCSPQNKLVMVQNELLTGCYDTVLHEFGHFISYMKNCELPDPIFTAEKESLSSFLRPYAATSAEEAFADIFRYCVKYHDDPQRMEDFKADLPQCQEFMVNNCPEIWD